MKPVGLISAGVLILILGAAAPTYARQDGHEEDSKAPRQEQPARPEKQPEQKQTEPAKQGEKPQARDQQAQPESQQQAKTQEDQKSNNEEQAKSAKQDQQAKQQQAKTQQDQAKSNTEHQQQAAKSNQEAKTQQAKSQQSQQGQQHVQRTAAEQQTQHNAPALRLSARGNGRIPDDRFHSNFGSEHRFRIGSPQMVGGYSRFQYGGYWFGFVQPWPVAWYYTDDVYVDYIDGGYYLYNPYYPGTRVSINVVI